MAIASDSASRLASAAERTNATLEALLAPLDRARSVVLRWLGRLAPSILASRSKRTALYVWIALTTAIVTTVASPVWTFALGPLVFGVPHLLVDLRYLVVRTGLHRRFGMALSVGAPLLLATLPLDSILGVPHVVLGLSAGFGAILFARASGLARGAALLAWALVVAAAAYWPRASLYALVHGHNFVAVGLFLAVFASSRRVALSIGVGFLALSVMLALGLFDAWLLRPAALAGPPTAISFPEMVRSLAPVDDPVLGARLACLFVFAQAVHYGVWIRLVPEEARERPGLRSFQSSLRALRAEVGLGVVVITLVLALAVLVRAVGSLEAARLAYLHASSAHGYVELAFLLWYLLEGRRGAPLAPERAC